ncbi:MAG TPA: PIN domain-containing protein [Candidatus Saccharimonadales bacterium]|nr:PIN domain-containing protein [Candidatus Saccharimonadales bacterium]
MKVFLDTSVLLAALLQKHVAHERAFALLERIQGGEDDGYISAHSVAEVYANLTKLPPPFRHSPEQALLNVEENILKYFEISSLSGSDYKTLIREAALAGIQGGTIYDAILLKSADKVAVERIYTLNLKHFQAIAPRAIASYILSP